VEAAIQRATGGAASEVRQENRTGLPDNLKAGLEDLSGLAMDDVRVHYNSSKPAEINAHAFTQGKDIHIASGQEKHLPHEAWHVVQQKQGRVKPTFQLKGEQVNDDQVLETEADAMGKKAVQMRRPARVATGAATQATTAELRERGATDASEVLSVAIGACGEKVHLNSRSTRRDDAPIQRSLLVGDELYTLSQLRKIGEEVKHKYDTDLGFQKAFKETNPVYKDLTWKQMLDPRINILINSAERYQFESWTALQEAIDSIWGTGEEKIPEKINSDYKMKLEEGPMKFEGSLEDLIEKLGSKSEWVQLKVDELWEAAKKSTNQKEAIRNLQTLWGACGPSAQALIERIAALGGKPKKILDKYCVGKYDASELQTLLLLPVKGTTLIQINEEKIHQYTIEKRTDGKAYFHQGYLSGYTAYWWAGLVNDVEPFLTLGAKAAEEIKKQRDIYGKLKAIPLETLASKLGEYLLTDVHGEASDKIWRTMPFHPEGSEELRWKGKTITLQVEVYQMGNESAVHQALEDTEETLPLIKLVMTETKKLIDSLNK
jgi:hypothetical protein